MIIKVVPLTYARAGELGYTLSLIAQPPLRIVPYYPTNSLVISGPPAAVEQLIDIIKPSPRDQSTAVPMRLIRLAEELAVQGSQHAPL
jgi:Bacterial type II/III secretion system short domain